MTDRDVTGPALDRRSLLAGIGTAASTAFAGCQTSSPSSGSTGDGGSGPANSTEDSTESTDGEGDEGAWTVEEDVQFRETPQRALRADVYTPNAVSEPPVVVHAHGGAWRFGDKGFHPLFERLAKAGYATVDVQYRLSTEATYPAPVRDVAAAVRWVRATADDRGVDPSRVALSGYSAGGHLAGLVATASDVDAVRPTDFHPDVDVAVDAFVGNAGVYDFTVEGYGGTLIRQFMGGSRRENPDRYEEASPIAHVDADDPPTLLCHGTDDRIVPFSQSERFATALRDVGANVERLTIDGAGHMFYTADRRLDAVAEAQIEFLDDVL